LAQALLRTGTGDMRAFLLERNKIFQVDCGTLRATAKAPARLRLKRRVLDVLYDRLRTSRVSRPIR